MQEADIILEPLPIVFEDFMHGSINTIFCLTGFDIVLETTCSMYRACSFYKFCREKDAPAELVDYGKLAV